MPLSATRPAARGHLLVEALLALAVLLLTIGGVVTAISASSRDVGIATDEQQALSVAENELERLREARLTSNAWDAGTYTSVPAGHPSWSLTTTISDATDPAIPGAQFKRARVRVDYRTSRTVMMEAVKW